MGEKKNAYTAEQKKAFAEEKNAIYRGYLQTMTPADLDEDVRSTLLKLRVDGHKLAVGSSSKNAPLMAKKRANGEGNIRKRKDGRWEGRYTAGIDPETGKPIAKSVLARTQRECKEKLQKAMEELEKIDITKRRDYTVGEWAQLWYENYAKPSVRASTAAYYKNYIDRHIVPRIGYIKLTALTTLQIQKFYNETKAHGRVQRYENMDDLSLSNKTIRGLHTMLRQCLEQAVTERLIPYNPANGCRLPKKEKKKMQIIPPEKIRDYLKAAEEWASCRCSIWN